jgi:hypothetical protein
MKNLLLIPLLALNLSAISQITLEKTYTMGTLYNAMLGTSFKWLYFKGDLQIMNENWVVEKTISMNYLPKAPKEIITMQWDLFDGDNTDFEIMYTYLDNSNILRTRILDENGTQLFDCYGTAKIVRTNTGAKLVTVSTTWVTEVYSLPGTYVSIPKPEVEAPIISAYPNPTTGKLTIEAPAGASQLIIYDMTGKQVAKEAITGQTVEYDAGKLPDGMYVYVIEGTAVRGRFLKN